MVKVSTAIIAKLLKSLTVKPSPPHLERELKSGKSLLPMQIKQTTYALGLNSWVFSDSQLHEVLDTATGWEPEHGESVHGWEVGGRWESEVPL